MTTTRRVRMPVSGKPVVIIYPRQWWWPLFHPRQWWWERPIRQWNRSLTDEYGWRRGGAFSISRQVKQ